MDTGLSRRVVQWAILSSLTGTVVVVVSYISRLPVGSRVGGWAYTFIGPFHLKLLLPFLIAGLLTSMMLWLSVQVSEHHEHATVLGWLVGGLSSQLTLRWYGPPAATLGAVVSSDANSFYSPTLRYGAFEFLSQFPDIRSSLPPHVVTNMPGKVMFFYLIELFTAKPEVMGIIIMALSNLGGW